LYGSVTIADVVRNEYVAGKSAVDPDLDSLPWLHIVASVPLDPSLPLQLGAGEAATLSLASGLNARAVLLDESYGRRLARQRGLPVVGTLGVLLAAKQTGQLRALRSRPRITFTTSGSPRWANGVVPFAVELGQMKVDLGQFLFGNFADASAVEL
jgi:predicted nucleic acid-binding protein